MHRIIRRLLNRAADSTTEGVQSVEDTVESVAAPVRKSLYRRFPVLFTMLTSFGVVITFLGFELLVLQTSFLYNNPLLMIVVGVTILVFTGKLFKKLG